MTAMPQTTHTGQTTGHSPAMPHTPSLHDPIPFTPAQGPNGWCLDLVPLAYIGLAASPLWDTMRRIMAGDAHTRVDTQNHPPAQKIARKGWSVWVWNDGSVLARKAKHDPLPFPMFLHPHGTAYPRQPRGLEGLDTAWLVDQMESAMAAWAAHDARVHAARLAAQVDPTIPAPQGARPCLLWWVPLHGPNPAGWVQVHPHGQTEAKVRYRDLLHAHWGQEVGRLLAETAARIAVLAPHKRPHTNKAFVDLEGAMPRPDGTIVPGAITSLSLRGCHPDVDAFLERRLQALLASDLALCTAWSAETVHADGTTMVLPLLVGAPLLPTRAMDLPVPSGHAIVEAHKAIEAERAGLA